MSMIRSSVALPLSVQASTLAACSWVRQPPDHQALKSNCVPLASAVSMLARSLFRFRSPSTLASASLTSRRV